MAYKYITSENYHNVGEFSEEEKKKIINRIRQRKVFEDYQPTRQMQERISAPARQAIKTVQSQPFNMPFTSSNVNQYREQYKLPTMPTQAELATKLVNKIIRDKQKSFTPSVTTNSVIKEKPESLLQRSSDIVKQFIDSAGLAMTAPINTLAGIKNPTEEEKRKYFESITGKKSTTGDKIAQGAGNFTAELLKLGAFAEGNAAMGLTKIPGMAGRLANLGALGAETGVEQSISEKASLKDTAKNVGRNTLFFGAGGVAGEVVGKSAQKAIDLAPKNVQKSLFSYLGKEAAEQSAFMGAGTAATNLTYKKEDRPTLGQSVKDNLPIVVFNTLLGTIGHVKGVKHGESLAQSVGQDLANAYGTAKKTQNLQDYTSAYRMADEGIRVIEEHPNLTKSEKREARSLIEVFKGQIEDDIHTIYTGKGTREQEAPVKETINQESPVQYPQAPPNQAAIPADTWGKRADIQENPVKSPTSELTTRPIETIKGQFENATEGKLEVQKNAPVQEVQAELQQSQEIAPQEAPKESISQRNTDNVKGKEIEPISTTHAELQPHIVEMAKTIKAELKNGGSEEAGNTIVGDLKEFAIENNVTKDRVENALSRIISGKVNSNSGVAKQVEVIIHNRLSQDNKEYSGLVNKIEGVQEVEPPQEINQRMEGNTITRELTTEEREQSNRSKFSEIAKEIKLKNPEFNGKVIERKSPIMKDLSNMMHEFGIEVVYYEGKDTPDGFYHPSQENVIFVKYDKDKNLMVHTAGHETLHSIKENHPELYSPLLDFAKQHFTAEQKKKFLDTYEEMPQLQADLSKNEDALLEEMLADELGNNFTDHTFWEKLRDYSQELFEKLVEVARKVMKKITGYQYETFIAKETATELSAKFEDTMKELKKKVSEPKETEPVKNQQIEQKETPKENKVVKNGENQQNEVAMSARKKSIDVKENENFKNWFKESKVVDEKGEPLVVYHGSKTNGFYEFKKEKVYSNNSVGWYGSGFYFAEDKAGAESYKGKSGKLFKVYLSIQKPFRDEGIYSLAEMKEILKGYDVPLSSKKKILSSLDADGNLGTVFYHEMAKYSKSELKYDDVNQALQKAGYDGVQFTSPDDKPQWVVFNSNQIKSVDNNGEFNPENNDIRYSERKKTIRTPEITFNDFLLNHDTLTNQEKLSNAIEKLEEKHSLLPLNIQLFAKKQIAKYKDLLHQLKSEGVTKDTIARVNEILRVNKSQKLKIKQLEKANQEIKLKSKETTRIQVGMEKYKAQDKLKEVKSKHKEQVESLKAEHKEDIKKLKYEKDFNNLVREKEIKDIKAESKERIKEVKEKKNEIIRQLKDKNIQLKISNRRKLKEVHMNQRWKDAIADKERKDRAEIKKMFKYLQKANKEAKHLRPDERALVETILGELDLKSKGISAKKQLELEELKKALDNNEFDGLQSVVIMNKVARLEKKRISEMTIEEIRDIYNTVKHLIHLSKTANKLMFDERLLDQKEAIAHAVKEVERTRGKDYIKNTEVLDTSEKERKATWLEEMRSTEIDSPKLVLEKLVGFKKDSMLKKVLYDNIEQGISDYMKYRNEPMDYLRDRFKTIGVKKVLSMSGHLSKSKHINMKSYTLESGKKIRLTPGQVMDILLNTRNQDNYNSLINGGVVFQGKETQGKQKITLKDIENMVNSLTPAETAVLKEFEYVIDNYATKYFNETTLLLDGYEGGIESYYRKDVYNTSRPKEDDLLAVNNLLRPGVEGVNTERVGSTNVLHIKDAFEKVYKILDDVSKYKALSLPLRNARKMLANPELQNIIKIKKGHHYLKALEEIVNDAVREPQGLNKLEKGMQGVQRYAQGTIISLNSAMAVKQYLGVLQALPYFELKAIPESTMRNLPMLQHISLKELAELEPILRDRIDGNVSKEKGDIERIGQIKNFYTGEKTILGRFGIFSELADKHVMSIVSNLAYVEAKYNNPNASIEELKRIAAKKTREVIIDTQPGNIPTSRSKIMRSNHTFTRLWTSFLNSSMKQVESAYRFYGEFKYNPSIKTFNKAVLGIVVGFMLPVILEQIITDEKQNLLKNEPFSIDTSKLKWAEQFISSTFPLLSPISGSLVSKLENGSFSGQDISNPAVSMIDTGTTASVEWVYTIMQFMSSETYAASNSGNDIKAGDYKYEKTLEKAIKDTMALTPFGGVYRDGSKIYKGYINPKEIDPLQGLTEKQKETYEKRGFIVVGRGYKAQKFTLEEYRKYQAEHETELKKKKTDELIKQKEEELKESKRNGDKTAFLKEFLLNKMKKQQEGLK